MSLASEIIADAADAVGLGSELLATDATITARALLSLRSLMETLRKNEIILEETVGATTTTIALPTLASDELDEPTAAREHLVNLLAVYMIPYGRVPLDTLKLPTAPQSINLLAKMYRQHTIPTKVPSTLLPRGQGGNRDRVSSTFFNGNALDNDAT